MNLVQITTRRFSLDAETVPVRMPASKFVRYILFGSIAVAIHLAIMSALVELLGVAEPIASQVGLIFAIVANYFMQRTYTFSSNAKHAVALPLFVTMSLVGSVINLVIFVYSLPYMHYIPAQCVAILAVFVLNFTISNMFLFRRAT